MTRRFELLERLTQIAAEARAARESQYFDGDPGPLLVAEALALAALLLWD